MEFKYAIFLNCDRVDNQYITSKYIMLWTLSHIAIPKHYFNWPKTLNGINY